MRPTFLGFEASKSALFASQKALDIVGNNLANISTEGYTRQRVDQVSVSSASSNSRYYVNLVANAGMGTNINGIQQMRDSRLDTAFRSEYSNVGYFGQKSEMLSDMEDILQELDVGDDGNGYGLNSAVKRMYTALQDFSNNVTSETDANLVASSINNISLVLNKISGDLNSAAEQYKSDTQVTVNEVNDMFREVADLNKSIRNSVTVNGYTREFGPNELLDQRNLLLDKLSAYGEVSVNENNDGTIDLGFNGHDVVKGIEYDRLNYQANNDGTIALNWKSDGSTATNGIGSLKASVDIINGRGTNLSGPTETSECGFLYYRDKLNNFAQKLADVLNNTIPASYDTSGNVLSYKKLVGAEVETSSGTKVYPDMLVTASNISITDELKSDSNYLIEDNDSTDNKHIVDLISKLTSKEHAFEINGDKFSGTFAEYISSYTGTLGNDVGYANGRNEASIKISNEMLDSRDKVSAVSESEETVNMMTYNRAFEAASRMMTVMDDLLDVLINRTAV